MSSILRARERALEIARRGLVRQGYIRGEPVTAYVNPAPAERQRQTKERRVSDKVDGLTGVVGQIDELNKHAERIAGELSANIQDLKQALDHTDGVSKKLGTASANLRRALGTNFPPATGE